MSLLETAQAAFGHGSAVAIFLPVKGVLPDAPLVCADEIARASRFRQQTDADAHLAGRHVVRAILGLTPPVAPFAMTAQGRPEFPSVDAPAFSISHSWPWLAVALSPNGLIGIDVETRLRDGDTSTLGPRVCHLNEATWLSHQADQMAGFLRIWTRKEAALKAIGKGLGAELTSIDTQPNLDQGRVFPEHALLVRNLPFSGGALAIAAQEEVRVFQAGLGDL